MWSRVCRLAATALLLTSLIALPSAADEPAPLPAPRVLINGAELPLVEGQKPFIDNGATMVPMRAVFEALGATVAWDPAEQTVVGQRDGLTIRLPIDRLMANVGGTDLPLATPARIVGDRTFVPLRFVSEALGAQVDWNGLTREVKITRHPDLPGWAGYLWLRAGSAGTAVRRALSVDPSQRVVQVLLQGQGEAWKRVEQEFSPFRDNPKLGAMIARSGWRVEVLFLESDRPGAGFPLALSQPEWFKAEEEATLATGSPSPALQGMTRVAAPAFASLPADLQVALKSMALEQVAKGAVNWFHNDRHHSVDPLPVEPALLTALEHDLPAPSDLYLRTLGYWLEPGEAPGAHRAYFQFAVTARLLSGKWIQAGIDTVEVSVEPGGGRGIVTGYYHAAWPPTVEQEISVWSYLASGMPAQVPQVYPIVQIDGVPYISALDLSHLLPLTDEGVLRLAFPEAVTKPSVPTVSHDGLAYVSVPALTRLLTGQLVTQNGNPFTQYLLEVYWRPDLGQLEVRWGTHLMTP